MKYFFCCLSILFIAVACQQKESQFEYELCQDELIFPRHERAAEESLAGDQIPEKIRAYIAGEFPGYLILSARSFRTSQSTNFYEVQLNSIGFLVFAENQVFQCVVSGYNTTFMPVDTMNMDTVNIDSSLIIRIVENNSCEADVVSFDRQILPLLASNCSYSGCHDNVTAAENLRLLNYAAIRSEVVPNNLGQSEIHEVITLTNQNSEEFMPQSPAAPLTEAQINLVANWINQGAAETTCAPTCNSEEFSFTQHIQPIIQLNCQGCHQPGIQQGNVLLNNYDNILISVTNGKMLGSIKHEQGFVAMPQVAKQLTDCQIATIENWITVGAPNN